MRSGHIAGIALALMLALPAPGRAELRRIDIRIFGMD
jgi:hypothetical protein